MKLEMSILPLSLGQQGNDVARLHQALLMLGRDMTIAEADRRIAGPTTVAIVKAVQVDNHLPPTGIVDSKTVEAINAALAAMDVADRTVRGHVLTADRATTPGLTVQVHLQIPGSEKLVGSAPVDADGSYQVTYKPNPKLTRQDLRVEVRNGQAVVETVPSATSILTNAGTLEVLDFLLTGPAAAPSPEFARLLADIKPLMGTRPPAELKEVSLLGLQSGRAPAQLAALAVAHRMAGSTKVPPEVFYALQREGLPADAKALQATHPDVLKAALASAVSKGTVPSTVRGKKLESYLAGLAPVPDVRLTGLLGAMLEPVELMQFTAAYVASNDAAAFWKAMALHPTLANRADKLKLTVQVASLTDSHAPLVAQVLTRPGIRTAADLAGLSAADWHALVQAGEVGVPAGTPGANTAEQADHYVGSILARIEAAFPTQYFAGRLGAEPVGKFLAAHPTFQLKTTSLAKFLQDNPNAATALQPADKQRLLGFQRLYRLTHRADDTQALAARGLDSAHKIAATSRETFVAQQADVLSPQRAAEVHARALQSSALALAVYNEHSAALNRTGLHVLPPVDAAKQARLAEQNLPDWQALFGSSDACACEDCASVHGAAAYYVDILKFLEDRGAAQPLFSRRPDLGDIELSCANTNTTLPMVDLVNEILEDAVAPPAPFTPFALEAALEADLAHPVLTPALGAAFRPSLATGSLVDVLEAGRHWRIWDQAFGYSVEKQGGALQVVARSRQTAGTAAERRAVPQYQTSAAYDALARAVFPWSLPFDLPAAESRAFLAQLGVPRRDLMEALRPQPWPDDTSASVSLSLAAEGLGLSDTERKIIVGEPLTPAASLQDFWGNAPLAALSQVQALLDDAGLTYAELDSLLATRFINPVAEVRITPDADHLDSCDTAHLTVSGLNDAVLSCLHRFVRLWRKLGWTAADLDRALCALAPDPQHPTLNNDVLVRLDHLRMLSAQLRLTVPQALALWRPLDTVQPGSLYSALFYNAAVFRPQSEDFRLRDDGQELAGTHKRLVDHASVLQAVLRLDAGTVNLLAAQTDGALNLANLSFLYRHALLAQQLHLPVAHLLTAIEITGIDPFQMAHTEDTLRFVSTVAAIQKSSFDLPWLQYLLRHTASTASPFVPTDGALAQALGEVRDGLIKVDAAAPNRLNLQEAAAVERSASALGLAADVARALLDQVKHSGARALDQMLALLNADATEPLTRASAQIQFGTLEKLLKAAHVIDVLVLPASQVAWLLHVLPELAEAPDPQPTSQPIPRWFALVQLQGLQQELKLQGAATEALLGTLTAVARATDAAKQAAAKAAFVSALVTCLDWPSADLEVLIGKANDPSDLGVLAVALPADFGIALVARLAQAMKLLRRLGTDASTATQWCKPALSQDDAKAIRNAAKSGHDDAAWQTVVTPLQDALREQQRDALVAYLAARPALLGGTEGTASADDLYTRFLIDVQMCSCQLTSRIKQAVSSVQLYAQRCLMGIEPGVLPSDPAWKRWNSWMKNYRVWEANRKIWLYPENWIEPELRNDKSPFFKDLESELLQSDLDNDAAEQALKRYLQKLHQVAQLEIVGSFEDEDKNLHVFGRTAHTPRTHFYRRQDSATSTWTPWEKLELDIEGHHLIPVVWNRKLMLIWPVFTLKQDEEAAKMPQPGESLKSGNKYWDLQLAWSEYQYGRWGGKHLSDPVRLDAHLGVPDILFGEFQAMLYSTARQIGNGLGTSGTHGSTAPGEQPGGGGGTAPSARPPAVVPADLITFKAFASNADLRVRCYLRLDYTGVGAGAGPGVAYPVGEFRFAGCLGSVTTAHRGQMSGVDFALAPKGTVFHRNGLDGVSSGLTLLDGKFVTRWRPLDVSALSYTNQPKPLPQDASATLAERIDIPVLGGSPSSYRLLAPHQDPQFLADRPFFYMDSDRAFVVSSTGSSHRVTNPRQWVVGDLATLGLATAEHQPDDAEPSSAPNAEAITVLVPGPHGTRVARQLSTFNLAPASTLTRVFPSFWSDRAYTFKNFHHPYVCKFTQNLDRSGIDALMAPESQRLENPQSFDAYLPTPRVAQAYPIDEVDFRSGGAYDLYNWELFFHIPLLIATRLSSNQRFEEAQRWFHYIFDPTGSSGGTPPQPYWRTKPFHDRLASGYEAESVLAIEKMATEGAPAELVAAVKVWRDHPFDPYAVARLRTMAFQKTVVMKYLDNLIAWGDQRFRGETIESINEATLLYVLAAEILGPKPAKVSRKIQPTVQTFNTLGATGLLGNAMDQIELLVANADTDASTVTGGGSELADAHRMLYFGVPENDKLLSYWGAVGDRLFKIRHCMNIDGQVRQLPLFEPPIDPALLVRATAAGISVSAALGDAEATLPSYRFAVMVQKAIELCGHVRALGSELLAAVEKQDAEQIALLRSGQEVALLNAMRQIKQHQVDEANAALEALSKYQAVVSTRQQYYSTRSERNEFEAHQLELTSSSRDAMQVQEGLEHIAAGLHLVPNAKTGSPTTWGLTYGGNNIASAVQAEGSAWGIRASRHNTEASQSGTLGGFDRRQDDWDHQEDLATKELAQVDKQIVGAQLRVAIADNELKNLQLQIDNATSLDEVMRGKFTNQRLYQWMIGQISGTYFQSYQLAYELAKRAERCLQHELGLPYGETSYIRFGYWDSLKKGLLAGDLLAHDLHRLDTAYLDRNVREYELTKHVSLLSLAPEQLVALKETGSCELSIPEWLFDLDTPGHYRRRLKTVSVTIPCVTGPYQGIHCKAQLLKSSYRHGTSLAEGYARLAPNDPGGPDKRFIDDRMVRNAIVTSSAQNDAGLFEPSLRDERYLPFEGAGAISTWRLELPGDLATFNHDTISDVILHLRYTARDDGALQGAASQALQSFLAQSAARPLVRMFSLRHEFPSEWHRFVNVPASTATTLTLDLGRTRFPYFVQSRQISICTAKVIARSKEGPAPELVIEPGVSLSGAAGADWSGQKDPGPWTVGSNAIPNGIADVFVVLTYTA